MTRPDRADGALAEFFRGERVAVLATLIRDAHGDFEAAEDALGEATARAVPSWRESGVPDRPGAWMLTVARRILVDGARRAHAHGNASADDHAADDVVDAAASGDITA